MTGNITPAVTVSANYAYCDAKITKDTDPSNVGIKNLGTPNHIANLWLKYKLLNGKLKRLSFAVGYQYMGKRSAVWYYNPDPTTRFLPVYNLLDASLSYSNENSISVYMSYNITGYQGMPPREISMLI
jgi:iron complex outermembrane receptor protein